MAKRPKKNPPELATEETQDFSSGQSTPKEEQELNAEMEAETSSIEASPSAEFLADTLEAEEGDTGDTAGTWYNGKRITGLWSKNQTRNAWARVSSLGWRKLANNHDTGITALNALASHAREHNRTVNLKIDANKIVELYVW